jgi:hypothetical protein
MSVLQTTPPGTRASGTFDRDADRILSSIRLAGDGAGG